MANIVETVIGDRRIQLGNEEFVRTLGVRTNWTKLRIGMRLAPNDTGANILSAAFTFGLCEGSSATFYNGNTTGFWGMSVSNGYPTTWTRLVSTYAYYTCSSTNISGITRIGNTTTASQLVVGGDVPYLITVPNHGTLYGDFDKNYLNTGAHRVTMWWNNYTANPGDHTQTEMFQAMEYEFAAGSPNTIPGARNYNGPLVYTYTGNINNLDTLSITWNKSTPTMEISDIMVLRFQ